MLFTETWDQEDFLERDSMQLYDVPVNSTQALRSLGFSFSDYKANEKIGCWAYERAWLECVNQHGHFEAHNQFGCARVNKWFASCKNQQNVLGVLKRYQPERFARSKHSRPMPNPSDVLSL